MEHQNGNEKKSLYIEALKYFRVIGAQAMDKKLVNNSNVLRFVEGLRLTAPNTVSLAAL